MPVAPAPNVQVAEAVTSCLVPFDKEAIAVNCRRSPMAETKLPDTVTAVTVGDGDVALEPPHADMETPRTRVARTRFTEHLVSESKVHDGWGHIRRIGQARRIAVLGRP